MYSWSIHFKDNTLLGIELSSFNGQQAAGFLDNTGNIKYSCYLSHLYILLIVFDLLVLRGKEIISTAKSAGVSSKSAPPRLLLGCFRTTTLPFAPACFPVFPCILDPSLTSHSTRILGVVFHLAYVIPDCPLDAPSRCVLLRFMFPIPGLLTQPSSLLSVLLFLDPPSLFCPYWLPPSQEGCQIPTRNPITHSMASFLQGANIP